MPHRIINTESVASTVEQLDLAEKGGWKVIAHNVLFDYKGGVYSTLLHKDGDDESVKDHHARDKKKIVRW